MLILHLLMLIFGSLIIMMFIYSIINVWQMFWCHTLSLHRRNFLKSVQPLPGTPAKVQRQKDTKQRSTRGKGVFLCQAGEALQLHDKWVRAFILGGLNSQWWTVKYVVHTDTGAWDALLLLLKNENHSYIIWTIWTNFMIEKEGEIVYKKIPGSTRL